MGASNSQSENIIRVAAIYARISSDKTGAGLGVERQEADCRELAARLGLEVKHVLVDNDVSAYSGKKRPGYEKLLRLIETREIGYVVAWHTDRLHRRLRDLLDYCDAVEQAGTRTVTVKAGDIDLSTAMGIAHAQMGAVFAENYVRSAREKLVRKKLELAQDGKYMGGQRPFGFEPQRVAVREDEAEILRDMARRVIDGYSFRTVAVELNRRGITTQHGKEWNALKVRNVLTRPINAGIISHHGVEYDAQTPAILSPDEWMQLNVAIRDNRQRSKHPGTFRKHLLSGFVYCGRCGARMYNKSKQQRDGSMKPQVWCPGNNVNTGMPSGCGKVSRMMEPIVDLVTEAVIRRLDSPQLAEALERQKTTNNPTLELTQHLRVLEARMSELTNDYYVTKLLSRDEFEALRDSTKSEITDTEKQIQEFTSTALLGGIDIGSDVRSKWDSESIEWRRDVLGHLIERIYVHPRGASAGYKVPTYKHWKFDISLIDIKWKV